MSDVFHALTSQAFLTLVLVIITGYYAYWTRRVVTATFEIEKVRKKPALVASVSRSTRVSSVVDITLENYGLSPAFKVTVTVKDDFYLWPPNKDGTGGNKFGDLYLVKKGFRVFAPGQKIIVPVLVLGEYAYELREKPYRLTVTYEDSQGEKETDELYIDFAAVPDHSIGEPEDAKARKALEKIAKEISSLTAQVKSRQ